MCKRLPNPDSALIKSESILFRRKCDLKILYSLAKSFSTKITEVEMSKLTAELHRLDLLKEQGSFRDGWGFTPFNSHFK